MKEADILEHEYDPGTRSKLDISSSDPEKNKVIWTKDIGRSTKNKNTRLSKSARPCLTVMFQ